MGGHASVNDVAAMGTISVLYNVTMDVGCMLEEE
jgi:hypothetical protein